MGRWCFNCGSEGGTVEWADIGGIVQWAHVSMAPAGGIKCLKIFNYSYLLDTYIFVGL